jgi:hypothetical protein
LHRVFTPAAHSLSNGVSQAQLMARLEAEQAKVAILQDQVADLRHRLEAEERRQTADRLAAAQERIDALLTDQQPAARSWWRKARVAEPLTTGSGPA